MNKWDELEQNYKETEQEKENLQNAQKQYEKKNKERDKKRNEVKELLGLSSFSTISKFLPNYKNINKCSFIYGLFGSALLVLFLTSSNLFMAFILWYVAYIYMKE